MTDIALGILAFMLGITLVSSMVVNICTQRLLSKCIEVLDAVMYGEPESREGTE